MSRPDAAAGRRKGHSRRADIPPELLARLNAGTESTATLAEGLAIDFRRLLAAAAPELPPDDPEAALLVPELGVLRRMETAGRLLAARFGEAGLPRFAAHPSDTVRGWAAYLLANLPGMSLAERLAAVRPLADDPHFGVREWAWLAVRPEIVANPLAALALLQPWTADGSANLRRFACEATRPRGVWCASIRELKESPRLAEPLLEPLRADPAQYVRLSVGNWLNDAAKGRPEWVLDLAARWRAESPAAETAAILRRGLRNLPAAPA